MGQPSDVARRITPRMRSPKLRPRLAGGIRMRGKAQSGGARARHYLLTATLVLRFVEAACAAWQALIQLQP